MEVSEKNDITKIQRENAEITKTKQITKEIADQDELTSVLLNNQVSFFRRIFPNEADKKIMEFQSNLLKQKADSKLENHRMFYEFQRQSIKETLDAILIEGKGFMRGKTISAFGLQLKEVVDGINLLRISYNKNMDMAWSELENIKNPHLQEENKSFLKDLSSKFFIDMSKLIERYRQILDELV